MHHTTGFLFAPFVLAMSAFCTQACTLSDFAFKQISWERVQFPPANPDGPSPAMVQQRTIPGNVFYRIKVVGELTNNCADPAGAKIRLIFRDGVGNVISTKEFWPASTLNIQPKSSFTFSWPGSLEDDRVSKMDASIIDVEQWK